MVGKGDLLVSTVGWRAGVHETVSLEQDEKTTGRPAQFPYHVGWLSATALSWLHLPMSSLIPQESPSMPRAPQKGRCGGSVMPTGTPVVSLSPEKEQWILGMWLGWWTTEISALYNQGCSTFKVLLSWKRDALKPDKRNWVVERIRHLKEMDVCRILLGGEEGSGCLGSLCLRLDHPAHWDKYGQWPSYSRHELELL